MTPQKNTWICDACGQRIEKPDDGWVQWMTKKDENDNYYAEGLQLVHCRAATPSGRKCMYDGDTLYRHHHATAADLPLPEFIGPDGLMRLLAFIDEKDMFKTNDEAVELIKRLFVPGYEFARFFLDAAISAGAYEPNTREGFPHQSQIDAVLEWERENSED